MKTMAYQPLAKSFKNRLFSLKEAIAIGVSRYELNKLVTHGKVIRISHGFYSLNRSDLSLAQQFKNAVALIGEHSIVCLLSALEFYDLTDLVSKEVWLMVPSTKRTRQKTIRLFRTANIHPDIGIIKNKDFSITSIERTLVDALIHPQIIPTVVAIESLRRALQTKKTSLSKIVDAAKKLGVMHRIKSYIEALS